MVLFMQCTGVYVISYDSLPMDVLRVRTLNWLMVGSCVGLLSIVANMILCGRVSIGKLLLAG
jgi:hypothetical protein